jgi:hypothetical protein
MMDKDILVFLESLVKPWPVEETAVGPHRTEEFSAEAPRLESL